MCEFTMLILQKYGFMNRVISFGFYSTNYKVYIHLPRINTQQQTTATFNITHAISSNDRQTPRLYQGSENCCEGDRDSDIFP